MPYFQFNQNNFLQIGMPLCYQGIWYRRDGCFPEANNWSSSCNTSWRVLIKWIIQTRIRYKPNCKSIREKTQELVSVKTFLLQHTSIRAGEKETINSKQYWLLSALGRTSKLHPTVVQGRGAVDGTPRKKCTTLC